MSWQRGSTALLLALLFSIVHADAGLPRVVSTSLCADQYLLTLAEPLQILALSSQAVEPALSLYADKAIHYPRTGGSVEELLKLSPDLVITSDWLNPRTRQLLTRFNIKVFSLPLDTSIMAVRKTTRHLAQQLGQADKGEQLLAAMQTRLLQLQHDRRYAPLTAAYFRPDGGSAGAQTYVHTLLRQAGLRNLAAEFGQQGWERIPLERLLRQPPDIIILSFFDTGYISARNHFRRHPLLQYLRKKATVIEVPARYWVCSGWFMTEAITYIQSAMQSLP